MILKLKGGKDHLSTASFPGGVGGNVAQSASMAYIRPYNWQWHIWGYNQTTLGSQCSFHTPSLKIFLTKANIFWHRKFHVYLLNQLPQLCNQPTSTKLLCIFFKEIQVRALPFLKLINCTLIDGWNKMISQK